jgi:nucleotide-binding universal stress UspA family protein
VRVLIATNGLSPEVLAAQVAWERPWPKGSTFCLMHVLDPYPFSRTPLSFDRAKELVLHNLQNAAGSLKQAGWDISTEICLGSPRRGINRFARGWRADLVMVGCNDASDLTRLFLGSTAQSVVRHAPCSVEVVRPRPDGAVSSANRPMKILIATDGSDFSVAALRSVANRPWPAGSSTKVISVPEFIFLQTSPYFAAGEVEQLESASLDEAKKAAAAGVEILATAGLKTVSEVPSFEDRPHRVILHEAETWGADLVVVGSHGRSGFDRFVMGSISEAVALHAKCSVEIIRESKLIANE